MTDKASSQSVGSNSPPQKKNTLIEHVIEYKELLAVLSVICGCAFWIFGYFATKQQIKELHCLLNANVEFIQGRVESSSLQQLLITNFQEALPLSKKSSLSSDESARLNRLKIAADEIGRKVAAAESSTAGALNRLKSGDCSGNLKLAP